MRLVFDVDDTVAHGGHPYSECKPYKAVVTIIKELKKAGHEIIFLTARYMLKHNGNQNKAIKEGKQELIDWLNKWDIPFDEVYLGKPSGDVYIDDRAWRIDSKSGAGWDTLIEAIKEYERSINA